MAKAKEVFICVNPECDYESPKTFGKCPRCQEWGTASRLNLAPRPGGPSVKSTRALVLDEDVFQDLGTVPSVDLRRESTGIGEFDRVLGGGIVPGSYLILGAPPGEGKSTLATQILANLRDAGKKVALIGGEESPDQIRRRFARMNLKYSGISISQEADVERIVSATIAGGYDFLVVDSIQTVYAPEGNGIPGSIGQVRDCGQQLMRLAKDEGITVLLIGQVTKEGSLAGPKVLEHLVDVVLTLEGDKQRNLRLLRASKNRFGSIDELGIFQMEKAGMIEVVDPSLLFIANREGPAVGSVACPVIEGSRPLLVEVQALVNVNKGGMSQPIRACRGISQKRFQLLLAVLTRRANMRLGSCDVFLQLGGGIDVEDPALDLAICLAIASAATGRPPRDGLASFGEVSLLGEIRPVMQGERRIKESNRLNFNEVLHPEKVKTLKEAIAMGLAKEAVLELSPLEEMEEND